MKKKRIMLLFMSLFAITPALLGSAWGDGETRAKQGMKSECQLMRAKNLDAVATTLPAKAKEKGSKVGAG